jgi:hypothetical protein
MPDAGKEYAPRGAMRIDKFSVIPRPREAAGTATW